MTTRSFEHLTRTIGYAWPGLSVIPWSDYGSKIVMYDEDGFPKATGLLMHVVTKPMVGACTQKWGVLPRLERSMGFVARKKRMLEEHPEVLASIQVRNPDVGDWGGAIRSSLNNDEAGIITGLPEIGDHIAMAAAMHRRGLLSPDDWNTLTSPRTKYMREARETAGMSERQFKDLVEIIVGTMV